MPRTRAFLSFDFDNDKALKRLHRRSGEIAGFAIRCRRPFPKGSPAGARLAKRKPTLRFLGQRCSSWAQDLEKRRSISIGYRDGSETWAVAGAGRQYRWNWDNLKKLLA